MQGIVERALIGDVPNRETKDPEWHVVCTTHSFVSLLVFADFRYML